MAIGFGKNEGFLLREEFVCKAIPTDVLNGSRRTWPDAGGDLPANIRAWQIDDALLVKRLDAVPEGLPSLEVKEQFIDTLMLRNANEIIQSVAGQRVAFVFHSHDYWGELDLCFAAEDGTALLLENKSGRVSLASRKKFREDIDTITSTLADSLEHRFSHVIKYLDRYRALAKRAFAACFLGVRCDVEKDSRDLWTEAAVRLQITSDELESRFQRGNHWLDALSESDTLDSYLRTQGIKRPTNSAKPILSAGNITEADLVKWSGESTGNVNRNALALQIRVWGTGDIAEYVTVQPIGSFKL